MLGKLAAAGRSEDRDRKETTMRPGIHYDATQARHHDLMGSAAQDRLAAQAKGAKAQTARRARRDDVVAAPGRRVLQRIWRLLPV